MTYTDFIHHGDAGIFCLLLKLKHGWRNIARGHDILLVSNRRFDDDSMESVRNQADDKIVLRHCSIQSTFVGNIERNWMRKLDAL